MVSEKYPRNDRKVRFDDTASNGKRIGTLRGETGSEAVRQGSREVRRHGAGRLVVIMNTALAVTFNAVTLF